MSKSQKSEPQPQSDIDLGRYDQNPSGIGFWALIREDYITHERDAFSAGFLALAVHRFGNWRMGVRVSALRFPLSLLYRMLAKLVQMGGGISLAYTVKVGRRVHIWHQGGMVLGALSIGNDVHIRQNTTFGVRRRGDPRWLKPTICDRCDVGAGAVVVGGITIGEGSILGANVVVGNDIAPYSLVTAAAPSVRPVKVGPLHPPVP